MRTKRRPVTKLMVLLAVLLALFHLSFLWGRLEVPLPQVIGILAERCGLSVTPTWTDTMAVAVLHIRLPRILLAAMVGCALSAAGTAYQCVFQNPMASPDILGASSGACFGAALAILLGHSGGGVTALAFGFSLLTVGLVYLIGRRARGSRILNMLLAGMMVSSLFSAGTSYIKLVADPSSKLPEITYWPL